MATYTSDVEALGGVAMGTSSGPSSRTVSVATDMSKVLVRGEGMGVGRGESWACRPGGMQGARVGGGLQGCEEP